MTRQRDPMLDAIRGVAILLVLIFHLRIDTGLPALDRLIRPLVDLGWVGVDLFFVLSGLLVGGIIMAEVEALGGFSRRRFFARRVLRLWPVLYLYIATMLLLGGAAAWPMVWPVILHVQNFATDIPSHLWSLAVEEHFYLAAAFGLPWLMRRRGPTMVARVLLATLLGCLALRIAALGWGVPPAKVQWQTPYRTDAIAAGVMLAWLDRYRPDIVAAVQRRWAWCLAGASIGFAGLAAIDDLGTRYGIGLTLAWGASALLIVALRSLAVPTRLTVPVGLLGWMGGISYSVYVWHVSLGRLADGIGPDLGLASPMAASLWRCAVAILGGAAVAIWVERPFMALRRRVTSSGGSHPTAAIAIANGYHR